MRSVKACRPKEWSHPSTFPCTECSSVLSRKEYLVQHIRSVHGGAEQRITCPREGCLETFTYIGSLRTHLQVIHEKKRRFICSCCEHGFGTRFNLDRHEETCLSWTPEIRAAYYEHHQVFLSKIGAVPEIDTNLSPLPSPPLSVVVLDEEEEDITYTQGPLDEKVCTIASTDVYVRDFKRLDPGMWLNDSIVDCILHLYRYKYEINMNEFWIFSTQFFARLVPKEGEYVYANVSRWTRRVHPDIFSRKMVFFPLHIHGAHWTLAVADMRKRTLTYYDSMGRDGLEYLQMVLRYLEDEHMDKNKELLPKKEEWKYIQTLGRVPQQPNDVDCGVFMCTFVRMLMEQVNEPEVVFTFSHVDIPQIRQSMKRILLASRQVSL
jgi:hypothetical protein